MKNYVLALGVLLAFFVAACGNDDDDNAATGGDPIDRGAILGSLEDVRSLIEENASGLDPVLIQDVSYEDNTLRVTLAESQDDLDTAGLEDMCNRVSDAIDLTDLSVTVEKADGSDSVECELGA